MGWPAHPPLVGGGGVSPSLYDLRRSGGRDPSSQDLKFIYSTRVTRGYQQHAVSPKILGFEKKI